ncbi:MAG: PQQ-binding-like beta-propeller repeat protein [Planctomycetota bacterium]|nr:PQQ-binding-like beta-propeller repeat protein [Planctomycetota bacterium]
MKSTIFCFCLLLLGWTADLDGDDWPRFRGPNGSGMASGTQPTPTRWSASSNLLWKSKIKGTGVSCPIVVDDKVLVTSYSGYGESRDQVGKMDDLKRHLTCFHKKTGKEIWSQTVDPVLPEEPFSGMGIPAHGYASHTPVSDGKLVFAFFGRSGVVAFDLDGNRKWTTDVGKNNSPRGWGSASSPIIYGDYVIVPATAESSAMIALDKKTGKEVWSQQADGFYNSWSTPILSKVDQERVDLVVGVGYEVWGLNPTNGKLRWYAEVHNSESFSSSLVQHEGVIYAIEGRRGGGNGFAIKAGGKKDASQNVVWKIDENGSFATPIVYGNRVYHFTNGTIKCFNSQSGELIYQERLPRAARLSDAGQNGGGRFGRMGAAEYASPVGANDLLYYQQPNGNTLVIKMTDQYNLVSSNLITKENEAFSATPAISEGMIFLRSNKHLYCVGRKKQ